MFLLPPRSAPDAFARHALARAAWDVPDGSRPLPGSAPRPTTAPDDAAADLVDADLAVEKLEAAQAIHHRDAWIALVDRALEPNVFLDPDFALPAAQHLAGARRPCFLLVWRREAGDRRRLVAVCPVVGRPDPLRALASVWLHDLATLAFPLLDREYGAAAFRTLLLWAGRGLPGTRGIVVGAVPRDGATAAVLAAVAAEAGLATAVLDDWERAVLRRGTHRAGLSALAPKGAKEVRRQRRRLAERGALADGIARHGDALRAGVERFLALEAGGWKGRAGTALLDTPGRTAFLRTATRLLDRRGLCRVHELTLDGRPVAMALVLTAGDADYLWKIAYREDVARLSPGVQLIVALTEAQQRDGTAVVTDSCAIPNHPMIDRLWRDRLALCDVAIATRPGPGRRFRLAVAAERGARRLRAGLKRWVAAARTRTDADAPAGS